VRFGKYDVLGACVGLSVPAAPSEICFPHFILQPLRLL